MRGYRGPVDARLIVEGQYFVMFHLFVFIYANTKCEWSRKISLAKARPTKLTETNSYFQLDECFFSFEVLLSYPIRNILTPTTPTNAHCHRLFLAFWFKLFKQWHPILHNRK